MIQNQVEEGTVVCNDETQKPFTEYVEETRLFKRPVTIEAGLLRIDDDGNLYCMDKLIETDQAHKVNRHVVMAMCKEIHKCVETGGGYRYVPIANQYNIPLEQLNQPQNRNKNKYVNLVRKHILGLDCFPEDSDYYEFHFDKEPFYLAKKNRKSKIKLTPKIATQHLQEPTPDMADRILQLEAENAQLRQRGYYDCERPENVKNEGMLSELPAAQAQYENVQPTWEPIVEQPQWMPLSQSPSLHWLRGMMKKDVHNYNPDMDKRLFGEIFQV